MKDNRSAIPVIMYHTVGRVMPDWKWSFLTVPAKIFEDHLRWLIKAGYQTVDLEQLSRHVSGEQILPSKSVVLTFDDGYLDNWTYVAPLLRKYGCKGTVFVNPDFVDTNETIRPTLEDVWSGEMIEDDLMVRGFMSWGELRHLAEHGPLSIEAHAMTHTWYPTGPEIVDFHHPDDGIFWLDWNAFPEKKPFYLLDPQKTEIPWGAPIYENQKSLAARRYFPDPLEEKYLCEFVAKNGGEAFFLEADCYERLQREVEEIRLKDLNNDSYETVDEQMIRYRFELTECKRILEAQLGKKINFLCWPGGGSSEKSSTLALEYFKSSTLASADPSTARNRPGENPRLVRRMGVPGIYYKGTIEYTGGRYFVEVLKEFQGVLFARRYRQLLKALSLALRFLRLH